VKKKRRSSVGRLALNVAEQGLGVKTVHQIPREVIVRFP
jgi:hypothetical protein